MNKPLVTINLVVRNGEKYIRHCLDAVKSQSYENIEVNVLDNNSEDGTGDIVKNEYPQFNLIESGKNLGLGGGMEKLLEYTAGKYKVALCVDVLMNPDFVEKAVETMEKDSGIGALQAKIYRYSIEDNVVNKTRYIDTCGFKIFRSRRLINIGHGEEDIGRYDKAGEVFSFEGAVPVFRVEALKDAKINDGEIYDRDYFWYVDDIDLGWRMRLMGWKSYYDPGVIAFHDRQTTKALRKGLKDFVKIRKSVPLFKRRLDWKNTQLTFIKNDSLGKDIFPFLKRQMGLIGYFAVFEPKVLLDIFGVIRLAPKMMKKRREIKKKTKNQEIEKWFDKDAYII